MYRFVIKKTYLNLILSLQHGESNIKECSNKIGINYSHLTIVLNIWETEGIIKRIRKDNIYLLELTEKGKEICKCLADLKKAIDSEPKEEEIEEDKKENKGDDTNDK